MIWLLLTVAHAGDDVDLATVLDLARSQAPAVQSAQAETSVAKADVEVAGARLNPSIGWTYNEHLPGANDVDVQSFTLSQSVLLDRQRHIRKVASQHDLATAQATSDETTADVEREAREDFVALLAQQERVRLLSSARADLDHVAKTVDGRQSAGMASTWDTDRVGLESAMLDARLADAQAAQDADASALATLLGRPGWHPHATGTLAPLGLDADPDALWATAQTTLPALVTAQREVDAAGAWVAVARRDRIPVPQVVLGAQAAPDPKWKAGFTVGLSTPIPIFSSGKGGLDAAQARASAAAVDLQAAQAQAHTTLDASLAQVRLHRVALDAFQRDGAARVAGMREMAEDAYANGRFGLLELLDAFESQHDAELTQVDLTEEVMSAEVDALAASGTIARQ